MNYCTIHVFHLQMSSGSITTAPRPPALLQSYKTDTGVTNSWIQLKYLNWTRVKSQSVVITRSHLFLTVTNEEQHIYPTPSHPLPQSEINAWRLTGWNKASSQAVSYIGWDIALMFFSWWLNIHSVDRQFDSYPSVWIGIEIFLTIFSWIESSPLHNSHTSHKSLYHYIYLLWISQ